MSKVVAEAREQVRERILSALGEAIAAGRADAGVRDRSTGRSGTR